MSSHSTVSSRSWERKIDSRRTNHKNPAREASHYSLLIPPHDINNHDEKLEVREKESLLNLIYIPTTNLLDTA